jgi:hypothetical protein
MKDESPLGARVTTGLPEGHGSAVPLHAICISGPVGGGYAFRIG